MFEGARFFNSAHPLHVTAHVGVVATLVLVLINFQEADATLGERNDKVDVGSVFTLHSGSFNTGEIDGVFAGEAHGWRQGAVGRVELGESMFDEGVFNSLFFSLVALDSLSCVVEFVMACEFVLGVGPVGTQRALVGLLAAMDANVLFEM